MARTLELDGTHADKSANDNGNTYSSMIEPWANYLATVAMLVVTWVALLFIGYHSQVDTLAAVFRRHFEKVQGPQATATNYYSKSDYSRYLKWTGRSNSIRKTLPRVLLLTWCTEDTYNNFRNEVYWRACYAHMHGFDVVLTDAGGAPRDTNWYTPKKLWSWWTLLQHQLDIGNWTQYDYVFITGADVLFNERWLHFPVWAFDVEGHDLTLMDQCFSNWGLNNNAFLFKTSKWSMDFLRDGLDLSDQNVIQADNGGYMEMILSALGKEAEADGREGYKAACYPHLVMSEPVRKVIKEDPKRYVTKNQNYSQCFFSELERLAGPFNHRHSKRIRFNPIGDATDPTSDSIVPWANCWSLLRDPNYRKSCVGELDPTANCFAYHWNGMQKLREDHTIISGSCPDPSFRWDLSPYNTKNRPRSKKPTTTTTTTAHYYKTDCSRYSRWPGRKENTCNSMPRVLLFTWCTEDTYAMFRNEMYWKACYAHAHGFDIVFTDEVHEGQIKTDSKDWYTSEKMWAWWPLLQKQLKLGNLTRYDYIFVSGVDVLFNEPWLHFPVWAFDVAGGHDLALMDQCFANWGLNSNAFMFRPSQWSMDFLTEGLRFMDDPVIQADGGAYMELILRNLGREREAAFKSFTEAFNRAGYKFKCYSDLLLGKSLRQAINEDGAWYFEKNMNYSRCFFDEFERLGGPFNNRSSDHIRFNPLGDAAGASSDSIVPWSNCWSLLRDPVYRKRCVGELDPDANCFAFHWNGLQKLQEDHKTIKGTCPDPTFKWELSPYNADNRGKK